MTNSAPSVAAVSGVRDARLSLLCPVLEPLAQPDALPELFGGAAAATAAGAAAARRARPWSIAARRMRGAARAAGRRARRAGGNDGTSTALPLRAAASAIRAAAAESGRLVPPRSISGGIPPSLALPLLHRFSGSSAGAGLDAVGARMRRWLTMSPPPPPSATTALLVAVLRLLAALTKPPNMGNSNVALVQACNGGETAAATALANIA